MRYISQIFIWPKLFPPLLDILVPGVLPWNLRDFPIIFIKDIPL